MEADLLLKSSDYEHRIAAMQEKIRYQNIDAVLIFSNETEVANVRYFTNYCPVFETAALVIPAYDKPMLLIGPETETLVQEFSYLQSYEKLLEFRESSDPEYPDIEHATFSSVFERIALHQKMQKIGLIGTNIMTVQVYEGILAAADGMEFVHCDELLREMRMIKSGKEISLMKHAASLAMKGFDYALGHIKPGMTELQATAECIYGVLNAGAESPGFFVWVVSGKKTNQAIGKASHNVLEKNQLIQITMGASYGGYVSSFGRPIVFGTIPREIQALVDVGLRANALTHDLIRPGVDAAYIARTVQKEIRTSGYGHCIVYGPGHGTGMMECEYPFIESISDYSLQSGMTFAVDTFLADKEYGLRFEDTVAVVADGEEQFANYKRSLQKL